VFNFVAGDIDGGANFNAFFVRKYDAPNWSAPTTGHPHRYQHAGDGHHVVQRLRRSARPPTARSSPRPGRVDRSRPRAASSCWSAAIRRSRSRRNPTYVIADVVVDGVSQGPVSSYTFTTVQATTRSTRRSTLPRRRLVIQFQADPVGEALALRWELSRTVAVASVSLERAENQVGPWKKVDAEPTHVGTATVVTDRSVVGGHTYWYRLVTVTTSGDQATFGPLKATAVLDVKEFSLDTVAPNPTRGALGINFAVAKPTHVHLSLLDVQGRVVEVFADGEYGVGRYQAQFDGQGRGGRIPAGVYFVRYVAARQTFTKRVVFTP
jgi:hypothetical protein